MSLATMIALWADELRDVTAMGLRFAGTPYDRERYLRIQAISLAMTALATGNPIEDLEPLRETLYLRPTPVCAADAAVIGADGRILLVKRADNGKWAMPGGASEVGETPAEGAMREVLEETGLRCKVVDMIGVFDSRLWGLISPHHIYLLTFLCEPVSGSKIGQPMNEDEVLDIAWYMEAELPDLIHEGNENRIPMAFRAWERKQQTHFDI